MVKETYNLIDAICTMLNPSIRADCLITIHGFEQCCCMPTVFVPHYKKKKIITMPVQTILGKTPEIITITPSTIKCFNRRLPVITNILYVLNIRNKPRSDFERFIKLFNGFIKTISAEPVPYTINI